MAKDIPYLTENTIILADFRVGHSFDTAFKKAAKKPSVPYHMCPLPYAPTIISFPSNVLQGVAHSSHVH